MKIESEDFPIFSSIPYTKSAAKILLAAKEDGNRAARVIIQRAISASIQELIRCQSKSSEVCIIWIPATRQARRRRGFDFLSDIATALRNDKSWKARVDLSFQSGALRHTRRIKDQSTLTAAQRNLNLTGAFEVSATVADVAPVIVFDDVVTTGSTLRAAVAALRERNLTVLGAATACATQLRMPIR
jgi:predicted amidophosphoribosyltransferase